MLAIVSIFVISIPSIVISIYITYLQTSLTYLFFTGLELAIISVLMMIFSVIFQCLPKDYLLEKKDEYQQGFDQDQLDGKSMEEIMLGMGIIEEEHH